MDETKKKKTEKNISKKSHIVIFLTVIVLIYAFIMLYQYVTNIIVDTNIKNMEELAEHDKQSIENTLTSQWNNINGIAR